LRQPSARHSWRSPPWTEAARIRLVVFAVVVFAVVVFDVVFYVVVAAVAVVVPPSDGIPRVLGPGAGLGIALLLVLLLVDSRAPQEGWLLRRFDGPAVLCAMVGVGVVVVVVAFVVAAGVVVAVANRRRSDSARLPATGSCGG